MPDIVVTKIQELIEVLADLKSRVRIAVAGELAQAVANAVKDVVAAIVAGRTINPSPATYETYGSKHNYRGRTERDPWQEE